MLILMSVMDLHFTPQQTHATSVQRQTTSSLHSQTQCSTRQNVDVTVIVSWNYSFFQRIKGSNTHPNGHMGKQKLI